MLFLYYCTWKATRELITCEGLGLHHVFFLERVMVVLERAHSCSTFVQVCTYRLQDERVIVQVDGLSTL